MRFQVCHLNRIIIRIACGAIVGLGTQTRAEIPAPPRSPDGSVSISLFASEPDIVTPIGATIDARGRLLVIESHSHFRPKNYQGPATDRIRMLESSAGAGKADHISTFYEGANFLMNLAGDPDGSVVVSARNEIFRLIEEKDSHGAKKKVTLARLETRADYPHNGLHGLALDSQGNVYFGIGENLGGEWTLFGSDGRSISDDKGSGAIFRVDSRGRGLTRIARGFWNPFGLDVDTGGTLWAVDNDPDGRPPSRLMNVVPGGDYGFAFRYGRTGMHPLQAWDGELPGTLGMVCGVGEAPCAVRWRDGRLLVSSWRDHQVESYTPTLHGATYSASMQPLVIGGENFRPVGLVLAPNRVLYVADWGSSSYSVNGKGRVWKLTLPPEAGAQSIPLKNDATQRAEALRRSKDIPQLLTALNDSDRGIAQAAQFGLSQCSDSEKIEWNTLKTPRQRIGLLAGLLWRGTPLQTYVSRALKDPDDRVRQMAVRLIAEQNIKDALDPLRASLDSQVLSPRLLGMTLATINQLNGDRAARIDSSTIDSVLLTRMNSPKATDQTKAIALSMLQASHPAIPLDQIQPLLQSPSRPLQLEAVRYLANDRNPARFPLLAKTAADVNVDSGIRAEAIGGLSDDAAANVDLLMQMASGTDAELRHEALRSLRPLASTLRPSRRDELTQLAAKFPSDTALIDRLLGKPAPVRPPETDIAAWQKVLDQAPGDAEAGRRIFFHPAGPACHRCHMIEGRGRAIGPDLTMIGHSQTREHVLESILDPSREIAPLFTLWTITTKFGQRIDGMLLRRDGQALEIYVDSTGQEFRIREADIVDRKIRKESLMPAGLVQALTDRELRDLVALLMQKR